MVNKFTAVSEYRGESQQDAVDTERRYNRVLRTIDHQTSPMQRPGVRPATLYLTLVGHGQYSRRGVKTALQAALDNDDAIAFRDDDGDLRFCLLDRDAIRRLVEAYPEVADRDRIAAILEGVDA